MALEDVVFPQNPFGYIGSSSSSKDLYNLAGGIEEIFLGNQTENSVNYCDGEYNYYSYCNSMDPIIFNDISLEEVGQASSDAAVAMTAAAMQSGGSGGGVRRRRRRLKSQKNREGIENQRRTHIAVERNRRKQMNEYLSVLRALMPASYVQRGDQASIIGGAINFVKELEHQVHSLTAQTDHHHHHHLKDDDGDGDGGGEITGDHSNTATDSSQFLPFSHFFTFPQYSSTNPSSSSPTIANMATANDRLCHPATATATATATGVAADIEVSSMVDCHVNLKIRCQKLPKQLMNILTGLRSLSITVLHLNISTVDQIVLYSFSLKVEEHCRVSTVDEIAGAVYHLLSRIQEEAFSQIFEDLI